METPEQQCLTKVSKLPLWIIEYIWAHKMADVLEDVDPSALPQMDSQPLSLEDSGRLRVVSAKVYSIVKNRDIQHFERVLNFLEDTYRLMPRLVTPIKHMKIMFGLKTMIIMWMLKRGRRMIDTMFKINQLFPSRLPQYQNQCSHREMFLMKKNHLDFKALAQSLAMDKSKLEFYVMNQMQQQYGEHYAKKVEDRLLQYLQKLETVLPGDAYIDKILKKESPVSEEEKLLLKVVSSDSATIATTLKKLLHCDVTFMDLEKELSEIQTKGPQSALHATSSETILKVGNFKIDLQFIEREEPVDLDISADNPLLCDNEEDIEIRPLPQTKDDSEITKENFDGTNEELYQGSSEELCEAKSSPQFCSKHQRWVKSILQECPEECSDDLFTQANVAASPNVFQSSSSHTSSQDLTPSNLIPCPANQEHPASSTSDHLHTPEKTCEKASSSDQSLLQLSSSRDTQVSVLPPGFHPIDIVSVSGTDLSFKLYQAFPSHSFATAQNLEDSVSSDRARSSAQCHSSGNHALLQATNPLENFLNADMDPGNCSTSTTVIKEHPSSDAHLPYCPPSVDDYSVSIHLRRDTSTSPFQEERVSVQITKPTKSCQQNVPISSIQQCFHTRLSEQTPPAPCLDRSPSSRFEVAPLRLSLSSQAVLLQSKLLQPCVSLNRLGSQHCYQATNGRSSIRREEPVAPSSSDRERKLEEEENADSSFDINLLYSSYSSSSGEDSTFLDPDYIPCRKKKRFLSEYEVARTLS